MTFRWPPTETARPSPDVHRTRTGRAQAAGSLVPAMSVLDQIVKAYDIRGTVHDEFTPDVAHALGVGFATSEIPRDVGDDVPVAADRDGPPVT